jgi:hypothetical protein
VSGVCARSDAAAAVAAVSFVSEIVAATAYAVGRITTAATSNNGIYQPSIVTLSLYFASVLYCHFRRRNFHYQFFSARVLSHV